MKQLKTFVFFLLTIAVLMVSASAADSQEILTDPGFEEENDYVWKPYVAATLEFTGEEVHSGDYSLLISGRSHSTDVLRQYVTEAVAYYGSGTYDFSAYLKLPEGTEGAIELQGVVGVRQNGSDAWGTTQYVSVSAKSWTHVSGSFKVSVGKSPERVEFYFVTKEDNSLGEFADILVDDCSLIKKNYEGAPYVAATPAPTAASTAAPTAAPTSAPTKEPVIGTPSGAEGLATAPAGGTVAPAGTLSENGEPSPQPVLTVIGWVFIGLGAIGLLFACVILLKAKRDGQIREEGESRNE